MTTRARGTFDVTLDPQTPSDHAQAANLGQLSLTKQFHGDLEAASRGVMLTVQTATEGSAGYVAVERVSGQLHGRSGTFVLQHNGLMARGEQRLTITVVPDSGTGDLAGLEGTMTIDIVDGTHHYDLAYTLPATGVPSR